MNIQQQDSPCHFKAGFDPQCPYCKKTDLKISLSEDLYGPANGQYEVVYCADCHAFLAASPVVLLNLFHGVAEKDKVRVPTN